VALDTHLAETMRQRWQNHQPGPPKPQQRLPTPFRPVAPLLCLMATRHPASHPPRPITAMGCCGPSYGPKGWCWFRRCWCSRMGHWP
jgi:hypothetical protein